jgi:protoporphyrinogen oxidase
MRVAIIGAGAAGLTAGHQLTKAGAAVDVFEASEGVGGLARTVERWGQKVDIGPHRFFSNDSRVNNLWLEVVGHDYRMVERLTRIYYRRRFFAYPLRPGNALWNMGFGKAFLCLASYAREKCLPARVPSAGESFESWVVSRFGRRLFEMFFKSYSEKLWGIPCHELDADFAAQRIKKFSLGQAIKGALGLGNGQHKTLVDRFAYPMGGTGMVYERMAEFIRQRGGRIHLRRPVRRLLTEGGRVYGLEFPDGSRQEFDHVISTMPLTLLVQGLEEAPDVVRSSAAALQFRNTILVYLHVDGSNLFPDQWLYIHSPDLLMGRVTNFRNWVPELYGNASSSILALEYWCYDQDSMWGESEASLLARASREIRATGLIGQASILAGDIIRIRRCYPVYARGYRSILAPVISYLRTVTGLSVIGRYGAFKYNNQDHSILMGLLAADNIAHGARHDLWAINTDYDNYQEAAAITETGLDRPAPPAYRDGVCDEALTPDNSSILPSCADPATAIGAPEQ